MLGKGEQATERGFLFKMAFFNGTMRAVTVHFAAFLWISCLSKKNQVQFHSLFIGLYICMFPLHLERLPPINIQDTNADTL